MQRTEEQHHEHDQENLNLLALDHDYALDLIYTSSFKASTPGKTFPSKNSKEAPPPVET